jgi:hypothetical protein
LKRPDALKPLHGVRENQSSRRPVMWRDSEGKKEQHMRKDVFVICLITALLVAGAAVASDWQKLGKKTVAFGTVEKATSIETKGEAVSQVAFKLTGDWVRLTQVTLNFNDGSNQIIEDLENVRPGLTSGAIAVDGGPKTITSMAFSFKSASSAGQGRATITLLGQ